MISEEKEAIVEHMKDFGLHMIGKGIINATFAEILNPYNHAMAIIHIAHGTEIIIKARIAEEHPLLIFSRVPKKSTERLQIDHLLLEGQTMMYSELPDRLWATTGYILPNSELYYQFGRIRNQITHFAVPDELPLNDLALQFSFELVEKLVNDWWDETLITYARKYDPDCEEYVFEQLNQLKIKITDRIRSDK